MAIKKIKSPRTKGKIGYEENGGTFSIFSEEHNGSWLFHAGDEVVNDGYANKKEMEANADFIVKSWNNYDEMISTIKMLIEAEEFKMGKSAKTLRIELAKDLIKKLEK